ncbi:HlyD family efflux transporter periplasmic adaptor subunit (plasmid) [Sinorhizobium meliloti]|nr:HlyD family efflux transporter periplasmic adaptor subunit [Sinorhizobium meliloti]
MSEKAKSLAASFRRRQADRADERAADRHSDPCRKSLRPALETHRDRRRLSELAATRGRTRRRQGPGGKGDGGGRACAHRDRIDFQSEIAGEITTARLELAEVEQRITAAEDVLRRLEIRAPRPVSSPTFSCGRRAVPSRPVSRFSTSSPEDEPLLVEMHVSTRDIDSITIGSSTQIRLTAYNQRSHLPLAGKVTYIAADQSVDEKSKRRLFRRNGQSGA